MSEIDIVLTWVDQNDPIEKFMPWVHKVYFVTWRPIPKWLNTDHNKLCIRSDRTDR
ncbi:MAG: hypothetical protein IJ857_01150 [Lachnospiraceae bacterium]|nr:hypothetical protein [Lachnospiraceae bacterium]